MPRTVAKVAPVRPLVDSGDHQVGQDQTATLSSVGEAVIERPPYQSVDGPEGKDHADAMAFNEEMCEVTVADSPDPREGKIVTISVDGSNQNFIRGQKQTVRRKYVEGLARAKPVSFMNQEYVDGNGDKAFRYPSTTGLRYPFTLDRDDNPKGGMPWLRKILAEA